MDWLGQLLGLPPCFLSAGGGTGVIQSTASEATLVGQAAMRAGEGQGKGRGALSYNTANMQQSGPFLPCVCIHPLTGQPLHPVGAWLPQVELLAAKA